LQRAAVPIGKVPAHQQPQTGVVATQPQPAGQQPGLNPPPPKPSTQQSAKKKVKKGSESLSNEKTKISLSERRGSIVKSMDKLASSIVSTDEANSAAAGSSSSMMPMFLVMQMQQQAQQQSQQQQLQQQLQFQQALMQRDVESQIKGVEAQVRDQREAMMKVLHSL